MPGRIADAATGEPMTLAEALLRTLRTAALDAGHVALIGPVPEVEYDVPATLVRSLRGLSALPPLLRSDFDRRQRLVMDALARIEKNGGFDPASASAPFVATLVDVTGLVIYFSVALVILRGTLL